MVTNRRKVLAIAFFCTTGWICNASAEQAEGEGGAVIPPNATPLPTATEVNVDVDQVDAEARGVQVSRYDTVSLNVQSTDLSQVLQLLSIQGERNIVPSPKVSGSVTANLYDVTFHEALDAILQQNGAGYIERGNFIFVYTVEELQQIQDAEREVETRVVRLDYLTAADAQTFISPLLSGAGSVAFTGEVGAGFQPSVADGGANTYSNAETLVIRDYPENIEEIATVLEQMDTPPRQVLVEATILQANLTEDLAFGVDMAILGDVGVGAGPSGLLGVVDDMITGDITDTPSGAMSSSVGNVSGPGGVKVGVLTDNVQVFVRALDQITDTVVLANPKIMTLNRQRAEVLVGERVAYVSTTATATATTQTVEFLDTGTQLTLRPFVGEDGMIRLELKPSISTFELRQAGSGTNSVTLPDEITQELTTNVMVRDGQTVVLGGLFKEETTIERNQVPGLGDIPIIGNAFKGRDDQVRRSEVIFLITPHIVQEPAMARAAEKARDGIEMTRFGMREGLLPWSRSKMTAGHVRDALRYLEEGRRDHALWEVDIALNLDPRMVEARRLREKLTGERAYWPDRSLLEETVDYMVREHEEQRKGFRTAPVRPDSTPTFPGTDLPPLPEPEETGEADAEEQDHDAAAADFLAPADEAAADDDADAEPEAASETPDSDESASDEGEEDPAESVNAFSNDIFRDPRTQRPLSDAASLYVARVDEDRPASATGLQAHK